MAIGILMDQEICLVLGQVSLSLLYWRRHLQTDFCGPGRDWQNGKRHPGQIVDVQNSGRKWEEMLGWGWSKNGQLKNDRSIMLEENEESTSLTLRTRKSKKPIGTFDRNWKHQCLPLCLARHAEEQEWRDPCKTNDFKTKFACILEASESTRMRTEDSLPNYHEDHVAGRGDNWLQHFNLVHKCIPMPQAMKIPTAKAAADKEWEKLKKILTWDKNVRNKSEVVDEAKTNGIEVHFASLMYICHLKNAELETKHHKQEGRIVLRVGIVKDDSGSYAVFTVQGSSASQTTATRVMETTFRLPGRSG